MSPVPVRVGPFRLDPVAAEAYPWNCHEHVAAGKRACQSCCGACYWLATDAGCALGSFKPVRCKTYPLIPQKDAVLIDERCPDAKSFIAALKAGDTRALALLEMSKAMSDAVAKGHDQSEEFNWLLSYTKSGFKGPALWVRPEAARKGARTGKA